MNRILKELTDPLNQEFSRYVYKYEKNRIAFCCTVQGFYAWHYSDDKLLNNISGFERCKGTRRDSHKRERSYEERIELEKESGERYAFYLLDLDQVDAFISKVRILLENDMNDSCLILESGEKDTFSTYDMGTFAMDWCFKMEKQWKIIFNPDNTNPMRNIIRFTTKEIESLFPSDEDNVFDSIHCWKNRHAFYEINLRGDRERMWISIKNKNDYMDKTYNKIFSYSNHIVPKKDWEFMEPWKTTSTQIRYIYSKKHLFNILDKQFEELKSWEDGLMKSIESK